MKDEPLYKIGDHVLYYVSGARVTQDNGVINNCYQTANMNAAEGDYYYYEINDDHIKEDKIISDYRCNERRKLW